MAGEYIEFDNNNQPAVNDTNLNRLQQLIKQDIQSAVSGDTLPIGTIVPFGSNTVPENWLLCDGSAVSRTQYQDLFNTIGIAFGQGDGFETFNLPNLQGRIAVGKDTNDTDFNVLGNTGGSKNLQEHNHNLRYVRGSTGTGTNWVIDAGNTSDTLVATGENAIKSAGTGDAGNLQPYIVTNYIIKAFQSAGTVATVVDNLNSTSTTDALSANQGKTLNENISVVNEKIFVVLDNATNIDNLKENGKYGIFNASGTLPSGYSISDNNVIIECIMWSENFGRQILHDVRTTKTYIRNLSSGVWQAWKAFTIS